MTDTPTTSLKHHALALANAHTGESPDAIVKRAIAYHDFLSGSTTKTAPAAGKPAAAAAAAAAAGASAGNKPAPAAGNKPAAAAAAAAGKPAPANKPANKPAAAPAASDDGLVMDNVSAALQKVLNAGVSPDADAETKKQQREAGKVAAYAVLEKIAGAKSVRDVKPALYAAVIAACDEAVAALKKPKPAAAATDDFGQPAGEEAYGDPPEHTGAGLDAEDM
jgi:hypothetical protein